MYPQAYFHHFCHDCTTLKSLVHSNNTEVIGPPAAVLIYKVEDFHKPRNVFTEVRRSVVASTRSLLRDDIIS